MGGCFSSESDYGIPTACVVLLAGELRQYTIPVAVSQVLCDELSSPGSLFLCNSDRLNFDDYVPSLSPEDELEPGQIYFVLPVSELQHRLTASDVAALAVKASVALSASNHRRNSKARISPVLAKREDSISDHRIPIEVKNRFKGSISRSISPRKLQRYASRRVKVAVRSFKRKLPSIDEESVLPN